MPVLHYGTITAEAIEKSSNKEKNSTIIARNDDGIEKSGKGHVNKEDDRILTKIVRISLNHHCLAPLVFSGARMATKMNFPHFLAGAARGVY